MKPKTVYVWSDGPRFSRPADIAAVQECRNLVHEMVDWECNLKTIFAPTNLGCRRGVTFALDFFFRDVEEGIVLEDDCVPSSSFFDYCTALLEKYRHQDLVMSIAGDNSAQIQMGGDDSYKATKYPLVWGWATWRRAWRLNDVALSEWAKIRSDSFELVQLWPDVRERVYWMKLLEAIRRNNQPDSWATIWAFSHMLNKKVSILPRMNLISNVGFDGRGSHTRGPNHPRARRPADQIQFPLTHPKTLSDTADLDRQFDNKVFYWPGLAQARLWWSVYALWLACCRTAQGKWSRCISQRMRALRLSR